MRRAHLLATAALIGLLATGAAAQVTVPLPGAGNRPPGQGTPVPLPGAHQPSPIPPPVAPPPAPDVLPPLPIGIHGRPDINPYERDIDMTVPLMFHNRSLGDVPVRLTADDRFIVDTREFLRLIAPLLNEKAVVNLNARLQDHTKFTSDLLEASGIRLEYDPRRLAAIIVDIEPGLRAIEKLFETPEPPTDDSSVRPARFSAYLNINATGNYLWSDSRLVDPTINLNGAMRLGSFVFEGDGQFADRGGLFATTAVNGSYEFSRNYARLVYDQPKDFRRWSFGDLDPEVRGQQSYVQMGGLSVVRERRRFNDFRTGVLQLNRQLVLQRDATVRIMRNGSLFRELRLSAGSYDFSSLPLLNGSNDIQVQIRDDSGAVQNLSYQSYLDPIDLEPGDYEYAAYLGRTSRTFGPSPTYDGPLAFSGFFRIAPVSHPAFGIGLQASARIQSVTGQTQLILWNAGRLLVDAGVSHARNGGAGFAGGLGYDQVIDRSGLVDSFTIRADYVSRRYTGLGIEKPDNQQSWSLNGQYTRAFTQTLAVSLLAAIQGSRGKSSTAYRIGATTNYRFSSRWSVRAGVEYSRLPERIARGGGLGFNVALVFQPNFHQRAEASYESNAQLAQLSFVSGGLNQINTLGYGAAVSRDPDTTTAEAFADYTANRFDVSLSHAAYGADFGHVADTNVTTVRLGTTLAFAGGAFGIGRRINDSFAIVYPHRTLGDHSVVAGQSIINNQYIGRSGALGGAVNNFLTSYVTQSIQYDVDDPPAGYDVGPGVYRVRPPYHSGYAIRVGTDAFASAIGTLLLPGGAPVSLAGGRLVPVGATGEPQPFFTNSVGRFAAANLYAGRTYRVELYGPDGKVMPAFQFVVPADTKGLVDLGRVTSRPLE